MTSFKKATAEDIPFIEQHAYRLLDFNLPDWRKPDADIMTKADINHNTAAILGNKPDTEVFIAFDDTGERLGFLHMTMQTDYYTNEKHAHITDIVVIKSAEGKGVGKLLMEQADAWALQKGARWITLNVFDNNKHAQSHYEKAGYKKEWIKYLKELKL